MYIRCNSVTITAQPATPVKLQLQCNQHVIWQQEQLRVTAPKTAEILIVLMVLHTNTNGIFSLGCYGTYQ
jgi:hypothetical protein